MSSLFSVDNPVFSFINKTVDLFFLTILLLLLCIPVITIGPASTAFYYAIVKVIRRERGYLYREFFKSFRLNFKRASIVGIILTVAIVVLVIDLIASRSALNGSSTLGVVLFGLYLAILFCILSLFIYVFPVLSRFDMNIKQLFKASFFMSLKHLPSTLGMLVILLLGILGVYLIPILIIILPGIIFLINSFLMEKVLKKYITKNNDSEDDSFTDKWYLE